MSETVIVLMTMVAVFLLLSNATLTAKQEDIEIAVEKKAFFLNDYKHDTSMAGDWARKDYRVIMMKINFLDLKLNMRQLVKDKKVSGNVTMKPDSNNKTKHGTELYNFQTCAANGTRPMNNGTCKPRPLGFMKRTFITCQTTAVTGANWARNGAARTWNVILNGAMMMADKVYSGVTSATNWTLDRMIWLAKKTMDGVIWGAEWTLDIMTWLVEKAWDGVILMGQWTWNGVTWLAGRIWCGLSWLASQIRDVTTWSGNVIAELYAGYLESHVTYVKACFTGLTWQDGNFLVIAGFVVRVSLLLLTRTMKVIRQRRIEREAQLAKETAERLAAAARKRKRASILNQKNRHKKKLV